MHVEPAACRAEAAHGRGRGVGFEPRRYLAQAKAAQRALQLAAARAVALVQESLRPRAQAPAHRSAPGIFGALTAAKNSSRSISSPAQVVSRMSTASTRSI